MSSLLFMRHLPTALLALSLASTLPYATQGQVIPAAGNVKLPLTTNSRGEGAVFDSLLRQKQYFLLQTRLADKSSSLAPWEKLYYESFVHNFFGQLRASARNVNKVLRQHTGHLSDSQRIALLKLNSNNYVKAYHYRQAYQTTKSLLETYGAVLPPVEADDLRNSLRLWGELQHVSPQKTSLRQDTRIPVKRDLAGLLTLPVGLGGSTPDFVFDTGANLSVITESEAARAQLPIRASYFDVKSSTGASLKARVAVAESIRLGSITVRNMVFMVFPDSALTFAGGRYKILGIIGYPVIEQLGKLRLAKAGHLVIPRKPERPVSMNFGVEELTPIINVKVNGEMLPFDFDTGANFSFLTAAYYQKYRPAVDAAGQPYFIKLGGAAGADSVRSIKLPAVSFGFADQAATLQNIGVKTRSVTENDRYFFGTIGQDLINQFDEMVISFRYRFIRFTAKSK
jgi:predicted aspartyl protease